MDQNKPLLDSTGTNPYPTISDDYQSPEPVVKSPPPAPSNSNQQRAPVQGNPYNYPPNQGFNQGYPPNQGFNQGYPPNQGFNPNQGYNPNQPYQPQSYPQNQGFQPAGQGQYRPPPPPQVAGQVIVNLPGYVTTTHPQYNLIINQCNAPCSVCSYKGADFISMTPGCTAYSWSICLFCFTGIFCFWIPFVADGCKDIRISCSRCRHTKAIIEKPCC